MNMYRKILFTAAVGLTPMAISCSAQETSAEDVYAVQVPAHDIASIKNRVKLAYGGQNLETLKSVRIQTDRGLAWPGQGQTPEFVEFVHDKFDVQIDLENQRASVERWLQQNGGVYHNRTVSAPDGGVAWIDYGNGTYQSNKDAEFLSTFGIEITGSDTLIARALIMDPHDVVLETPAYYLGKWHDRVTFKIRPEGWPGTAYIEQDSGRIIRFEVKLRDGTWNAVFSDFRTSNGITYARRRMDFRDDKMLQTDPDRRHSFNTVHWAPLELEDDLVSPPEEIDMSKMTVDTISDTIHHVGQEDYSVFIDAGDHILAINPNAGFKDRYDFYKSEVPNDKPLRHVLITHHHSDHLEGIEDAMALGATIAAPPMTVQVIKDDEQFKSAKLYTLKPTDQFGPVNTFTIPSNHAAQFALIYMPGDKVLYQDDHYYPTLVDGPSHVNQSGLVLRDRVQELGLDVDILLSGHARKAEKWTDFAAAAVEQTLGDICPRNREICRE